MEKKLKSTIDNFVEELIRSGEGNKLLENMRSEIINGGENIEPVVEDILKVARRKNYNFSKDDFYEYIKDQLREIARGDELSDDELSKASGGIGGGQVGKYAVLFAGTAGLGGLAYSAFSGGLFGGRKGEKTSSAVGQDKKVSKSKDKKLGKGERGLDDLDSDSTSDEVKKLYKSRGSGGSYGPGSRLKRGSKRKIPSSGSYGMGRSSYGSPSSSYGSEAAQRKASKVRNNLLNFLDKCSEELQKKGMNITPDQLYSAIMSGKLEEALGDKFEAFISAIQNGNINEAVNLVVSSLVKSPSGSENISKQPRSNEKYENLKDNKKMPEEAARKLLKGLEKMAQEERVEEKKEKDREEEERKVEKDNEKKEDIKPADIKENKGQKPADVKEENKRENIEEKIKLYSVSFAEKELEEAEKGAEKDVPKKDVPKKYPIESFDVVYIEDETKPEEIENWFKKIKEDTKKEKAVMFIGKDTRKIEEVLKKADKDIVISKNKKLGGNQIVAIIKDSEDKKVEKFFNELKDSVPTNIKGSNVNKSSTSNEIAREISKKMEEEKNNKKQEEKKQAEAKNKKEELEKQRAIEESKKCLDDTLKELTEGNKIVQLAMVGKNKDKGEEVEDAQGLVIINSGADAEKIQKLVAEEENGVLVEIVEEKGKSQVAEILNKEEWQEIESNGWFTRDKAKSAKVFVRKKIVKILNNKNDIVEKFDVFGGFEEGKEPVPIGDVKDLVANIGTANVENKKATDVKKQLQEKAKGTDVADMKPDFMFEIKKVLNNDQAVVLDATFSNFKDQFNRKVAFVPKNKQVSGERVAECDFVVKKCDSKNELNNINQKQGWISRFFKGHWGDKELKGSEAFVALPAGETGKNPTIIFARKRAVATYINVRGREIIKKFLLEGEGKKYNVKEDDFGKYYAKNYNPANENYWNNITEAYNQSPAFKKIIDDYRDSLTVESKAYDYLDSAKNFSGALETINNIKAS